MCDEWAGIKVCVMSGLVLVWEMSGLVLACNEWTCISVCVMSGLVLKCA